MKTKYLLLLPVFLFSCSTPQQLESVREPAAAPPADRFVFNGELSTVFDTLTDPEDFKQTMKFARQYQYMVEHNLHDTGVDRGNPTPCTQIMKTPHRTSDGRCYFINQKIYQNEPNVGAVTQRFGRNSAPPEQTKVFEAKRDLLEPNPRLISKELLERKNGKTIEVPTLNLFAAAWLQMENHDWFSHGKNVQPHHGARVVEKHGPAYQKYFDMIQIPAVPGDTLFLDGIQLPRTRPDLTSTPRGGYPVTYRNAVTHWWDASQLYGSDAQTLAKIRTNPETGKIYAGGLIAVDEKNRRLYYENGVPITGFNDNWWVGLELLHSLFAMEHNSVARMLKAKHPNFSDDEIFEKSRLVIAALMAKIHTIEWTPALLDNKIGHIGMRANWSGVKRVQSARGRQVVAALSKSLNHFLNGLTGPGGLNLNKAPFTLTEEFVSVYRMHPLLPDFIETHSLSAPEKRFRIPMQETAFGKAEATIQAAGGANPDLMYSFLTSHPGALTLNNFPKFMQPIEVQRNTDGMPSIRLEMGTVDIVRDRERLVPRYNEFRRQLGLKPIATFADLNPDKAIQAKLEEIYGGDVEKLDLQIGTLAENDRLQGFAFGITPFSIFQLMASRRLMADPFFTEYFTTDIYTVEGMDWIDKQTFRDVVARHYPELRGKLKHVVNGFHPWNE